MLSALVLPADPVIYPGDDAGRRRAFEVAARAGNRVPCALYRRGVGNVSDVVAVGLALALSTCRRLEVDDAVLIYFQSEVKL